MPSLNIVLVEPEIPQNTGNIARTCAVTGAALHLVGPMGFRPAAKKLRHAGLDYWRFLSLFQYDSLSEFFQKNTGNFFFFSTKARLRHSDPVYPDGCYLFFGKESAGLPEDLLFRHPERCVRIPMLGGARSLNLANSVAVGAFEVLRQWDYPALECRGELRNYDWAAAKAEFPESEYL